MALSGCTHEAESGAYCSLFLYGTALAQGLMVYPARNQRLRLLRELETLTDRNHLLVPSALSPNAQRQTVVRAQL